MRIDSEKSRARAGRIFGIAAVAAGTMALAALGTPQSAERPPVGGKTPHTTEHVGFGMPRPLEFRTASLLGGCSITSVILRPDGQAVISLKTPVNGEELYRNNRAVPPRAVTLSTANKGGQMEVNPTQDANPNPNIATYRADYNYGGTLPGPEAINVSISSIDSDLSATANGSPTDFIECGTIPASPIQTATSQFRSA
jgi:hypothetical protein